MTSPDELTNWWASAITDISPGSISLRGYPVESLIGRISYPQVVWLLLRGELPTSAQAALLESALVAAVDHGPQAPSIAAARMAATCGIGLNGCVATGVNLLGDVHGGAGQQLMQALTDIVQAAERNESSVAEAVRRYLAGVREAGDYVPGFGHRFHPHDPRRDPLIALTSAAVADGAVNGDYLAVALEIERQLTTRRGSGVPMNIDGATAVVYSELGFAPELGRGLFVLSRAVGILAHAWEESGSRRRIKGPMPPNLLAGYTGPAARRLPEGKFER